MTNLLNSYVTLKDFKESLRSSGGAASSSLPTDAADDADIQQYIWEASRAFDTWANRYFYQKLETLYYDAPYGNGADLYTLRFLDRDVLAVISLTNGDTTSVSSSSYKLYPANLYPKAYLTLLPSSGLCFLATSGGDWQQALTLSALTGYHDDYGNAWVNATTINNVSGYTSADTSLIVTSGAALTVGQVIRFGTGNSAEQALITGISTNTLTVQRGVNGTTAASISNTTAVYFWNPMGFVQNAVRMCAIDIYRKRTGDTNLAGGTVTMTAGGFIIRPQGFPAEMQNALLKLKRTAVG